MYSLKTAGGPHTEDPFFGSNQIANVCVTVSIQCSVAQDAQHGNERSVTCSRASVSQPFVQDSNCFAGETHRTKRLLKLPNKADPPQDNSFAADDRVYHLLGFTPPSATVSHTDDVPNECIKTSAPPKPLRKNTGLKSRVAGLARRFFPNFEEQAVNRAGAPGEGSRSYRKLKLGVSRWMKDPIEQGSNTPSASDVRGPSHHLPVVTTEPVLETASQAPPPKRHSSRLFSQDRSDQIIAQLNHSLQRQMIHLHSARDCRHSRQQSLDNRPPPNDERADSCVDDYEEDLMSTRSRKSFDSHLDDSSWSTITTCSACSVSGTARSSIASTDEDLHVIHERPNTSHAANDAGFVYTPIVRV